MAHNYGLLQTNPAGQIIASSNEVTLNSSSCCECTHLDFNSGFGIIVIFRDCGLLWVSWPLVLRLLFFRQWPDEGRWSSMGAQVADQSLLLLRLPYCLGEGSMEMLCEIALIRFGCLMRSFQKAGSII